MKPFDKALEMLGSIQEKAEELFDKTPAKDAQEHLKTWMNQNFQKMNLVTREEFDVQTKVLERTRKKLQTLEHKVAELEKSMHAHQKA